MKRLLLASLILAGCFVATTGNAQVYVQAKINFGIPVPHPFCPPPPPRVVVYSDPAPVYYTEPAPVYYQQPCERPVIVRRNDYETVRYYDNNYRSNNREYYEREDRGHGHGHGHGHGWKKQRGW